MEQDLVSSVLARLKLSTSVENVFEAGGRWAIRVPSHRGLKIHTVLKGTCWITVGSEILPKSVTEGDIYLLPRGDAFQISSEAAESLEVILAGTRLRRTEGVTEVNGGGDYRGQGLHFDFESPFADTIFQSLPSLIILRHDECAASNLVAITRRFGTELGKSRLGSSLVLQQLAPVILVDLLRSYLESGEGKTSWFGAAADRDLARTLSIIHRDFRRHWTLSGLATESGVSRTKLATTFKRAVGVAPMEYLSRWRMDVACELLQQGRRTIAEVAESVGYESESAFSTAFLRTFKVRPGAYQKEAQAT